jgi:hypothetical protein
MFTSILLAVAATFCATSAAFGQSDAGALDGFWGRTKLVGLAFDTPQSLFVRSAAQYGFELSEGGAVDLNEWYSPKAPNISATFLTQVTDDLDVIWGTSLGEVGKKYRLGTEVVLGLAMRRELGRRATMQLDVYGQYGGALREVGCLGDYADLGGVQPVNCRLAASILPPEETLAYLWQQPAQLNYGVRLTVVWTF